MPMIIHFFADEYVWVPMASIATEYSRLRDVALAGIPFIESKLTAD